MNQFQTEAWTIKRLLDWTSEHFRKHGSDAPRLAAEVLLAEALDCRRIDLYARYDQIPAEPALAKYRGWIKRHSHGEPVAYLVGHRDFFSLRYEVNSSVLIPRPETEELVVLAIDEIRTWDDRSGPLLDIGTGSGCIAVTLAAQFPELQVVATDISQQALELARRNAHSHGVESRVEFVLSDLFQALPIDRRFRMIVGNPPYVGESDPELDGNVRKFEPALALFGGAQGSELTRRLIEQAANYLEPGGLLLLESSPMLADELRADIQKRPDFESCKVHKDSAGLPRVLACRRKRTS